MKKFTNPQIQTLKDRNSISTVVGAFVTWDRKKTKPSKQEFWACCPFHSEKSPSFKCDDHRQTFKCFGCGASGDVIEFLQQVKGYTFQEAVQSLGGELEVSEEDKRAYRQRQRDAEEKDRRSKVFREELAMDLWKSSVPANATLAETYFKNRVKGWDGFHSEQIRFHPQAYYTKNLKLPCVVCLVTGPDGNPVGVWRIFLNKDGTNYRDETGKKVKKGLGPCMETGGAIRLFPATDTVGTCEGVETGYGAWNLNWREIPIWPTMATSGMVNFQPPFGVERVLIFPDPDQWQVKNGVWQPPPGKKAADTLLEKMRAQHVTCAIDPQPDDGLDHLEQWNLAYDGGMRVGGEIAA